MKLFKHIFLTSLLVAGASSCTDDLKLNTEDDQNSMWQHVDLENSLMVPLAISLDNISASTRNGNDGAVSIADDDQPFQSGNSKEHAVDFDSQHECFIIFFDDDGKFMTLKPLFYNTALGSGGVSDGIGEYKIYALAYLTKPEGWDDKYEDEEEQARWEKARLKMLPKKALVVLNGGRIYSKLIQDKGINEAGELADKTATLTADDFLDYTWDYNLGFQENEDNFKNRMQIIGVNSRGYYTMTNSAYYAPVERGYFDADNVFQRINSEDEANGNEIITRDLTGTQLESAKAKPEDFVLRTVAEIDRTKIVPALATNIKTSNSAANIYVERMVAKFSAPIFKTEVIGSNKVLRPSGNAQEVVIYKWDNDGILHSETTNWRVHILGWSINAREKSNYLFKHIRNAFDAGRDGSGKVKNWNRSDWNDPVNKRSYWSIDPHYDYDTNPATSNRDFYPWQYRGALDKAGVSWTHQYTEDDRTNYIALRYLTFSEMMYWDDDAITISENTFNPYATDYQNQEEIYLPTSTTYMDNRASQLMGPHLLVTAQVFIQDPNSSSSSSGDNDYVDGFSRVSNLYCDRYFRYTRSELDCFRLFVKDINDALKTQTQMNFKFFDWNSAAGNDNPHNYEAVPTGHCALMFDCELDTSNPEDYIKWTDEEKELYKILQDEDNKKLFHLKPVSECFDALNSLFIQKGKSLFMAANVKDGDGRIIPWIPGMVFRNVLNPEAILKVYDKTASPNAEVTFPKWTNDMRKSLIFEWFGPVDHYVNGYMYYSAPIPHYVTTNTISSSSDKETYFGAVRNHWYTFTVTSINSLGIPVSDINQRIIPARYNYQNQMSVYVEPMKWHVIDEVGVEYEY